MAAIVEQINIVKAYSPDLPGEFSGGSVQIETLDFIFEKPIFRASDLVQVVVQASGAGKATVQRVLKQWQEADVLKTIEEAAGRRAAVYAYRGLLNIAEGREAF